MRVCIAGAGKVGRAIARELIQNGHEILLVDRESEIARVGVVEGAHVLCADACEVSALEEAQLQTCQVVVAATGDELLDWREMVAHYPGARHRVIQGSDHGLSDFADYQDEVLAFAGIDPRIPS